MPVLFGIDIAEIVAQEVGPGVLPATLLVVTPGTRDPGNPSGGTEPTVTSVVGRGFIDTFTVTQIGDTLVLQDDRKVTLITNTFASLIVPKKGDRVIIENIEYNIIAIANRDPTAATYECLCRQ